MGQGTLRVCRSCSGNRGIWCFLLRLSCAPPVRSCKGTWRAVWPASRHHPRQRTFLGGSPVRTRCPPAMSFGADDAGKRAIQHAMYLYRIERAARTIDEGGNTIFLGFRNMIGKPVEFLGP